ncbi:MAG: hypothetical protein U0X91_14555 [Spirosomataceae bacterium]
MRKWIFLGILLLLIGGIFYYVTFGYYSDGTRVGSLVKLSRKGYIFKTHEGQLMVGGMSDGTGTFNSTTWDFSVDDDNKAAIEALNLSQRTGQRVALHYEEKFFQLPWNGDTKYFVVSVELIPAQVIPRPAAPSAPQPAPTTPTDTGKAI